MTLDDSDLETGFVVANEVKFRAVEACVEHHVLDRGLCSSAVLSIEERGEGERRAYGTSMTLHIVPVTKGRPQDAEGTYEISHRACK